MRSFRRPNNSVTEQPHPTRRSDSRVGGWRVGDRLARTETSEIFAVVGRDGRRAVAKRLQARVAGRCSDLLYRECEHLRRFANPAVVRVIDQPAGWLILEHLKYGDLRALAGAPPNFWLSLIVPPFQWLATLHSRGFVHGDLKLSHLMLRHPTQACWIDLATVVPVSTPMLARTPSLALPEEGLTASFAADVYAVGVMLHELLVEGPSWPSPKPLTDLSLQCRAVLPGERPAMHWVVEQLRRFQSQVDVGEMAAS